MTTKPSASRTKTVRRFCYGCVRRILLSKAYKLRKERRSIQLVEKKQLHKFVKVKKSLLVFKNRIHRAIHPWYRHGVLSFIDSFRYFTSDMASALLLMFGIFSCTFWIHSQIFKDLPDIRNLSEKAPQVSTKILDRNGTVLYRIYEDENRTIIPLSQIPKHMAFATIAIEDKDFYNHHGFSIRGISRAFKSNIEGKTVQGGSTITQQLVKNRLLSSEKTVTRKVRELILSILVEMTYSKNEILEMYLNTVPYGGATYGIEEAAQKYFNKHAAALSLAEAAMLAGLPAAPSDFTPFGSHPELAYGRQEEVLRRMREDGYISDTQAENARQEKLVLNTNTIEIEAPHFVMHVRELLADAFGEEVVTQGGLIVRTTLDSSLQSFAEETVQQEVSKLARLNISNGAALITNPQTGEVLAMVGSVNYFDYENDGQVNVTTRPRQPGSSIKPLTYALALSQGFTPATIIQDTPITYHIAGSKPYSPSNYDGTFHGNVSLRESLASSYNIPAVKMLAQLGVPAVIDAGEQLGISTWTDRSRFGLSLTLGGGEVLMTEMAQLYGSFAADGWYVPLNPIIEVTNYRGETLYKNRCVTQGSNCRKHQVFSDAVAYLITNILSDNTARSPAFGLHSSLSIPNQEVAVKTGTTNNLRDNWTFGYTTDRLVSVWVGNNDNSSMSYVASGITGASPIWNTLMRRVIPPQQAHKFEVPTSVSQVAVCKNGKSQQCARCQQSKMEYFMAGTEPSATCDTTTASKNEDSRNRNQILDGIQFSEQ